MNLTQDERDCMIQELAESEFESLTDGDLLQILIDGCDGWSNVEPDKLYEDYINIFGKERFDDLREMLAS